MGRKSFDVDKVKDRINNALAVLDDRKLVKPVNEGWPPIDGYSYRRALVVTLEDILHETGNYRGFRYLDQSEVPPDNKPGINVGPDGEQLPYEQRFGETDRTRVCYH